MVIQVASTFGYYEKCYMNILCVRFCLNMFSFLFAYAQKMYAQFESLISEGLNPKRKKHNLIYQLLSVYTFFGATLYLHGSTLNVINH